MSTREQLEQSMAVLGAQRSVLGDAVVDPAITTMRDKLVAIERTVRGETRKQRKQITVLFADVCGFTAMAEALDAEDISDTLNALWRELDVVILDDGGASINTSATPSWRSGAWRGVEKTTRNRRSGQRWQGHVRCGRMRYDGAA